MGLKQDVVIVNEFSVKRDKKNKSGKAKGTRGGTPGDYVMRYMARTGAVENLAPIKHNNTDEYITRYMARKDATERLKSVPEVKNNIHTVDGLGGVVFGQTSKYDKGNISMSDGDVRKVSKDIQSEFDKGKVVLKTIISFDEEYLRANGIIDEDFECKKKGDYRGNIDQMKLRLAIMDGMKAMGDKRFNDVMYTGVIQVDTKHVHAHLCIVDKGEQKITRKSKLPSGMLSQKDMQNFRLGVDKSLKANNPMKMLSSNVQHDKYNTKCFVKKFTHKVMNNNGFAQFLLACLPVDKRLWRANTNNKQMKKANSIVKEYVVQLFNREDSGYDKALQAIDKYASERVEYEGLGEKEYRMFVKQGQQKLIDESINSVYDILKNIPENKKDVRTPMLDAMSLDYESMASELKSDPMMEFGFKLRSYASRLNKHKDEKNKYRFKRKEYEEMSKNNEVSRASSALYDFYKFEEEYNDMLLSKYQHFLSFLPSEGQYRDEFDELLEYRDKMQNLKDMVNDKSIRRMKPENAENYGVDVYEQKGGRFVKDNIDVLNTRYKKMETTFKNKVEDFKNNLSDNGLSLNDDDVNDLKIVNKTRHDFEDVKALDLHHLGYDFSYDVPISLVNIEDFVKMSNKRYDLAMKAEYYLKRSDQDDFIGDLPMNDIVTNFNKI